MILKQNCTTVLNDLITFDDSLKIKNLYDDLSSVGNISINTTWPSQEFTGTQSYSTLNISNVTIIDVTNQGRGSLFPENNETGSRAAEEAIVIALIVSSVYLSFITTIYYVRYSQTKLKWTNILCCLSAFVLLVETSWFQLEVYFLISSDLFCSIYFAVNVTLATGNRTIVYIVFWIRQRSFYRRPSVVHVSKRKIGLLSNCLLVAIIFFGIIQIVTLSMLPSRASPSGCKSGKSSAFLDVFTPVVFSVITLFQIILLIPVLYPVVKHIQASKRGLVTGRLESIVVRLCVCASTCLITDILFLCASINEPEESSFSFIAICYAANTLINITAMLTSFGDYKFRLLPFACVWKVVESRCHDTGPVTSS